MTIKDTQEIVGKELDWAALTASLMYRGARYGAASEAAVFELEVMRSSMSRVWSDCGPFIENFGVWLSDDATDEPHGPWIASISGGYLMYGETALIASCRAIVNYILGSSVNVPEGL